MRARDAMAIGTAGLAAMLAILALEENGLRPGPGPVLGTGPVLVNGAAGGVGSTAIALLSDLGYEVTATTGRPETTDYLKAPGATQVIDRAATAETTTRPMETEQ